jgi:hypothetical protein
MQWLKMTGQEIAVWEDLPQPRQNGRHFVAETRPLTGNFCIP